MLKIIVRDNSSVDRDELVSFNKKLKEIELGRKLSPEEICNCERYVEHKFNSFITKSFLGYDSDGLVGWLGVNDTIPSTLCFNEYHPVIFSNSNRKRIALELIGESIVYARKENIGNVRVFVEVTKESENRFLEFEKLYLSAGMKNTHVVLCMENKLSDDYLKKTVLDKGYHIEPLNDQTKDSIQACYDRIFSESYDNFTNSLDAKEREYFGVLHRGKFNEASVIIKRDKELVSLIGAVDYSKNVVLGPIGVVPNNRRKRLGKVLMETCLSSLIKQRKPVCYLEVDETNVPAINLYTSYGFFEVAKKHGFLFRTYDNN